MGTRLRALEEFLPAPFGNGIRIIQHLTRNVVHRGDYACMVGNLEGATD